jgi:hypothetical protein
MFEDLFNDNSIESELEKYFDDILSESNQEESECASNCGSCTCDACEMPSCY